MLYSVVLYLNWIAKQPGYFHYYTSQCNLVKIKDNESCDYKKANSRWFALFSLNFLVCMDSLHHKKNRVLL